VPDPDRVVVQREAAQNYPVAQAGDGKSMPIISRIMHALFAIEKKSPCPSAPVV